jgi:hypothetical protein
MSIVSGRELLNRPQEARGGGGYVLVAGIFFVLLPLVVAAALYPDDFATKIEGLRGALD